MYIWTVNNPPSELPFIGRLVSCSLLILLSCVRRESVRRRRRAENRDRMKKKVNEGRKGMLEGERKKGRGGEEGRG